MEVSGLLDLGEDHVPFMAAKRARMAGRPAQFFDSLRESLPVQTELLSLIVSNLRAHHGARFRIDDDHVHDMLDGTSHRLDDAAREPIEIAADIVEEDLILLDERDDDIVVIAASNAYSTTRRIVSCVGRSMRFAHEMVPGLNSSLGGRIDRVLGNLKIDMPAVRYNWAVVLNKERLAASTQPVDSKSEILHADHRGAGELLWIRSERQKFIRLPETGKVAFLLYTYSDPLSAISQDFESLTAIHRLLGEYSDERLRYSGMASFREPLMRWLAEMLQKLR